MKELESKQFKWKKLQKEQRIAKVWPQLMRKQTGPTNL